MRTWCLVAALSWSAPALAVPLVLTHTGRVLDATGDPVEGLHGVTVRLFPSAAGGTATWSETSTVPFTNGYFSVLLGAGSIALDAADLASDDLWVELVVDQGAPLPRQPLTSVPFAVRADTATNVDGGIVRASEVIVDGVEVIGAGGQIDWSTVDPPDASAVLDALSCSDGEVLVHDAVGWGCAAADAHQHHADDVATGTLDVARLPVGSTAGTVAAGVHTHAASAIASGQLDVARLPVGTTTGTVAAGDHVHAASALTSGTLDVQRLPVGGTAGTVAAGDHVHAASALTSGTLAVQRLPVGTTAGTVAAGDHGHALSTLSGTLSTSQLPPLATVASSGSFGDLVDAPDTLGTLACGTGQVPEKADQGWTCVSAVDPTAHTHAMSDLTNPPATWPPSAHTHPSTEITTSCPTGMRAIGTSGVCIQSTPDTTPRGHQALAQHCNSQGRRVCWFHELQLADRLGLLAGFEWSTFVFPYVPDTNVGSGCHTTNNGSASCGTFNAAVYHFGNPNYIHWDGSGDTEARYSVCCY